MIILKTENLSKHYGKLKAVDQLTLQIESGKVYGLLGPNGSGKTTTLGMILNVISKTAGNYTWFEGKYGENPRKRIGAILETPNFYPHLDAWQNLRIVQRIKDIKEDKRIDILKLVNLYDRRKSPFQTYSLGMKQRLAIAAALIGEPEVLIFDEPTNGLDPQGIAEIRNIILDIANMDKTIIMASHILDEVEKICTHVAILKKGKLLSSGSVGAILEKAKVFDISCELDLPQVENIVKSLSPEITIQRTHPKRISLHTPENITGHLLNKHFHEKGVILSLLVERKKRLEEEFLTLTK